MQVEIANRSYVIQCSVLADEVNCILYDRRAQMVVSELLTLTDVLKRSKELNPFMKFETADICETLDNSKIEQATFLEHLGDASKITLQVTYRIRHWPFYFEWHFQKLETQEFQFINLKHIFASALKITIEILELRKLERRKSQESKTALTLDRIFKCIEPFSEQNFDANVAKLLLSFLQSPSEEHQAMNQSHTETTYQEDVPVPVEVIRKKNFWKYLFDKYIKPCRIFASQLKLINDGTIAFIEPKRGIDNATGNTINQSVEFQPKLMDLLFSYTNNSSETSKPKFTEKDLEDDVAKALQVIMNAMEKYKSLKN